VRKADDEGWERVVFAQTLPVCELCEEPLCEKHKLHYANCSCLGPTEDDVEYKLVDGILYGRRVGPDDRGRR